MSMGPNIGYLQGVKAVSGLTQSGSQYRVALYPCVPLHGMHM